MLLVYISCAGVCNFYSINIDELHDITTITKQRPEVHSDSVVECLTCGFEPLQRRCVVSFSMAIFHCLILVQVRKTHPDMNDELLKWT